LARFVIAQSSVEEASPFRQPVDKTKRGLNVWTLSELRAITGHAKDGKRIHGTVQNPMFNLAPEERIGIMAACDYVQAVIGSRMQRMSSMEWTVIPKKQIQDKIEIKIKHLKQLFDEYDDPNNLEHLMIRLQAKNKIKEELFDLKDDMSNFDSAFLRFKKRTDLRQQQSMQEIIDWINQPNQEDTYESFTKKYFENLLLHGARPVYKEWSPDNRRIENYYNLPGGTVYPMRSIYVGGYLAYAQIVINYEPSIYFSDEISFSSYLPSAARSYGYVPLDALVNKIAEQLLFAQYAAERADGNKEPEKLIIFGDTHSPFAGWDGDGDLNVPMDAGEQQRIEEKLNVLRKGAIASLSGVGQPVIADISKADTFPTMALRQDKLLRDIALVFNLSNMEINLAGGEFTNGRETSESQQEIDEGKGTTPLKKDYETFYNKDILPYRFGTYAIYQFKKGLTENEQVELDAKRAQSTSWTKNEIRIARGAEPIIEQGNDSLQQTQPQGQQPDGSQMNPFNMRNAG